MTTGAFYGYCSNKDALFSALTEPHATAVIGEFIRVQETFAQLSDAVQPSHMGVESQDCLVNYLYADMMPSSSFSAVLSVRPISILCTKWVRWKSRQPISFGIRCGGQGTQCPKSTYSQQSGMFCGFFKISWCTICRRNRQSSMSPLCGRSIRPDGKN